MKKLPFTKMHWIWNDFIVLNQIDLDLNSIELTEGLVKKMCHRNFGIWSDWIVVVSKGDYTEFKYIMYNPDWTQAEMCGNGIRCYMKYLVDTNLTEFTKIDVETWVWILKLDIEKDIVTVDMWKPDIIKDLWLYSEILGDSFSLNINDNNLIFIPVSMWNPHAVIYLDNISLKELEINKYWPVIEKNIKIFPNKTNVEFIEKVSKKEINMRVWERWAWETLACWTWACASVVAWVLTWKLESNIFIKVNLLWWVLEIKWSWKTEDSVIMRWKAETTFEGNYIIN